MYCIYETFVVCNGSYNAYNKEWSFLESFNKVSKYLAHTVPFFHYYDLRTIRVHFFPQSFPPSGTIFSTWIYSYSGFKNLTFWLEGCILVCVKQILYCLIFHWIFMGMYREDHKFMDDTFPSKIYNFYIIQQKKD